MTCEFLSRDNFLMVMNEERKFTKECHNSKGEDQGPNSYPRFTRSSKRKGIRNSTPHVDDSFESPWRIIFNRSGVKP